MKHQNRGYDAVQDCGPKRKDLKNRLKSLLEAKEMLKDLDENGHMHYDLSARIRGMNLLDIENIKQEIKNRKKGKK